MVDDDEDDGGDWVEVAAVGDDEEAEIIAGLLESEDIPCEIEGASASPWPENLGALGVSPRHGAAGPRRRGAGR